MNFFKPGIAGTTLAVAGGVYWALLIHLAILFIILYPIAAPASGNTYACANPLISIEADEPVGYQLICNSADDALAFFDRLDVKLTSHLVIEVAQNLPDGMSKTAVGCYDKEAQKAFVLTFPEFEKRQVWVGGRESHLLYLSLVTHEVAHAVANCNFTIPEPTYHAEEYVAYVAMFATMNPALRAHLLKGISPAGFDREFGFNEITYSLDPMRFGVEAYRHYLKKEHGDDFILQVLSGHALTNSAYDLP